MAENICTDELLSYVISLRNESIVLASISFLILMFLMYIAYRIFKIIQCNNKVMLGMIICLNI